MWLKHGMGRGDGSGSYGSRRIMGIGLLLAAGILLAGCGRKKAEPETPEETVVTIWTSDYHDARFQQMMIDNYNRSNPDNIRVEYKIFSDNYFQSLNTAFQSHGEPDMMLYTPQVFDAFFAKNYFADLTPYMDDEFRETFGSVLFDGINVIGGRCYYVPTGAMTSRLYYNRDIFERAGIAETPETMEELVADARRITGMFSGEGIYGFAANMNTAKQAIDRSIIHQGTRELGLKAGYDFDKGCYDFAPYEPLLTLWRELMREDCAYPHSRQMDIAPLRQLFAEGKIGMYFSYNYSEKGSLTKQFPMEEAWGCAQVPTTSGVIRGCQEYTPVNGFLFNAKSEKLDAAWNVYRAVFTDREYLEKYQEQELGCSLIPEVQDAWLDRAAGAGYGEQGGSQEQSLFQILPDESMWPRTPHELNAGAVNVQGMDLYDTMKDLIFGGEDIGEGLKDLTDRYQEAYQTGIRNNIGREIRIENFDSMNPNQQSAKETAHETHKKDVYEQQP